MNRFHILSLSVATALGLALLPGSALAQQKSLKEQLAGTWTIISNDNVAPDGTKRQLFGPHPKGILVLPAKDNMLKSSCCRPVPTSKSTTVWTARQRKTKRQCTGPPLRLAPGRSMRRARLLSCVTRAACFPTRWEQSPNAPSP